MQGLDKIIKTFALIILSSNIYAQYKIGHLSTYMINISTGTGNFAPNCSEINKDYSNYNEFSACFITEDANLSGFRLDYRFFQNIKEYDAISGKHMRWVGKLHYINFGISANPNPNLGLNFGFSILNRERAYCHDESPIKHTVRLNYGVKFGIINIIFASLDFYYDPIYFPFAPQNSWLASLTYHLKRPFNQIRIGYYNGYTNKTISGIEFKLNISIYKRFLITSQFAFNFHDKIYGSRLGLGYILGERF